MRLRDLCMCWWKGTHIQDSSNLDSTMICSVKLNAVVSNEDTKVNQEWRWIFLDTESSSSVAENQHRKWESWDGEQRRSWKNQPMVLSAWDALRRGKTYWMCLWHLWAKDHCPCYDLLILDFHTLQFTLGKGAVIWEEWWLFMLLLGKGHS